MQSLDHTAFGPTVATLLREPGLPGLTVGAPNPSLRARVQALDDNALFASQPVVDRGMADACRAGLWLYFDFFDESHQISQGLHTVEGSYWHAILHRREPDADNAKYWFHRVGTHPVFAPLRSAAAELATDATAAAAFLKQQSPWDPFAFVDLCEESHTGKVNCTDLCLAIQRREWELLFAYCYQEAIGREN